MLFYANVRFISLQTLRESGFKILGEPRKTGDGYYEFETLDPDNNRLEVTTEIR